MPSSPLTVIAAGKTDVGRRRQHNEDAFASVVEHGLFVVADGMGGHAAGEIASEKTIETMTEFVSSFDETPDFTWPFGIEKGLNPQANLLVNAIKLANRTICSMALEQPEYSGMGTTVVGARVEDNMATVAHVGDSRLYLLRDGELKQMTQDHSWVQEQIQQNLLTEDEAKTHRWRNVITRALGNRFEVEVDSESFEVQSGDILLVCTDGLSGPVPEKEITKILLDSGTDAEAACDALIKEANRRGGPDNITAIVVHITESK